MKPNFLKNKRNELIKTTGLVLLVLLGVVFIINHTKTIEISLYITGSLVILYCIWSFVQTYRQKTPPSPFITIRYIILFLVLTTGVSMIVFAKEFSVYYKEIIASAFLFLAVSNLIASVFAKRMNNRTAFVWNLIHGLIDAAVFFFLRFVSPDWITGIGIVSGTMIILECLYALYKIWLRGKLHKKAGGPKYKVRTTDPNPGTSYHVNGDEIVITDFEIIDGEEDKPKGS